MQISSRLSAGGCRLRPVKVGCVAILLVSGCGGRPAGAADFNLWYVDHTGMEIVDRLGCRARRDRLQRRTGYGVEFQHGASRRLQRWTPAPPDSATPAGR